MKLVGRHLTYSGKRLGSKLVGNGKTLGNKMGSHNHRSRHYLEEEDKDYLEEKSDLERGHKSHHSDHHSAHHSAHHPGHVIGAPHRLISGNIHHHIPRDGQLTMIHGLSKGDRAPFQRKKNH
jgi:hypothetical protein